MADDYYRFVEQQHVLYGENTKKTYRLGDKVAVQVVRVDLERRQIDLGLVDILETVRDAGRPRQVRSRVKGRFRSARARDGRSARKKRGSR
jgi:ribonuclease R